MILSNNFWNFVAATTVPEAGAELLMWTLGSAMVKGLEAIPGIARIRLPTPLPLEPPGLGWLLFNETVTQESHRFLKPLGGAHHGILMLD